MNAEEKDSAFGTWHLPDESHMGRVDSFIVGSGKKKKTFRARLLQAEQSLETLECKYPRREKSIGDDFDCINAYF